MTDEIPFLWQHVELNNVTKHVTMISNNNPKHETQKQEHRSLSYVSKVLLVGDTTNNNRVPR